MSPVIEKLLEVGDALELALGHRRADCPKVSSSIPCTCGSGLRLQEAVRQWDYMRRFDEPLDVGGIILRGDAMVLAAGHKFGCPRLKVPCVCGSSGRHADALAVWEQVAQQVKEQ
jgi:hypothetical protein